MSSALSPRPSAVFWEGVRDGTPFIVMVGPFALLFGVVAAELGLSLAETLGFSTLVIAGAAQFATLELLDAGAPVSVAVGTGLAVNLRMALYSASLVPYLGALALLRFQGREEPQASRLAYYAGAAAPICGIWILACALGAQAQSTVAAVPGLDFAVPLTFLAMVTPMLKDWPSVAAAVVAMGLAILGHQLPLNSGMLLAVAGGMVTGATLEGRREAHG
ncbi:MAG: branched-chain amino acid ABC transporter permease [Gammaproteobacteria bacterium]|nr:branched-chain amino acid ABC transporter permease [Gammaproteobacteria bacterium]